jgi:hypothetical protein
MVDVIKGVARRISVTARIAILLALVTTLGQSESIYFLWGRSQGLARPQWWFVFLLLNAIYIFSFVVMIWCVKRLSQFQAKWASIGLAVVLSIGFAYIYPRFGAPTISGFGDRDDALNLMAQSLIDWNNPYSNLTYLGQLVSPLLGSTILGFPAYVLAGSAAWLNPVIVWAAFLCGLRYLSAQVVLVLGIAMTVNYAMLNDFLLGGDAFTVPLLLALTIFSLLSSRVSESPFVLAPLVLIGGLAGASRTYTVLVVVAVVLFVLARGRTSPKVRAIICMGAITASLTLASLFLSGGPGSWPFTGYVDRGLRIAVSALVPLVMAWLIWVWRRTRRSGTIDVFALTAPLLSFTFIPLVLAPGLLWRSWSYLILGLPIVIKDLDTYFVQKADSIPEDEVKIQ